MKKVAALLAVAIILGLSFQAYAKPEVTALASGTKIGYVDMQKALNDVKAGKAARAKLEADGNAKKQKLEIVQKELKKMKDDLDKQRLILSRDALQEKEAAFQQKFFDMQKMTVDFEREFAEKEKSLILPITKKLASVITSVAQDNGYTMVVPKAMALYGLQQDDLTDAVIKKFDKTK